LESGHNFESSLLDKRFAFIDDVWRDDVINVEGWNFNLDSLDAVTSYDADSLFWILASTSFGFLDADKPLELGFQGWLRSVRNNIIYF
jgi:hypothetical protein